MIALCKYKALEDRRKSLYMRSTVLVATCTVSLRYVTFSLNCNKQESKIITENNNGLQSNFLAVRTTTAAAAAPTIIMRKMTNNWKHSDETDTADTYTCITRSGITFFPFIHFGVFHTDYQFLHLYTTHQCVGW